jgi:hypothetical protein
MIGVKVVIICFEVSNRTFMVKVQPLVMSMEKSRGIGLISSPTEFSKPDPPTKVNFPSIYLFGSSLLLHHFFSFNQHWHRTTNDMLSTQWPSMTNAG